MTMELRWSTLKSSLLMAKKKKSTNWYIKLEDKWVMSHYNSIIDEDNIVYLSLVVLSVRGL